MASGKRATVTFGKALDIDWDMVHDVIDSVNITSSRAWIKVKIDNEWREIDKKIELK